MSDELNDILLEVREDATNLREYLSKVGTTADQLGESRGELASARDGLDAVAKELTKLISRVDDLVTEVLRLDPGSINDRLSRLFERLEIIRDGVEDLRDLKLGTQVAIMQAQLRQQRILLFVLLAGLLGITGMLGVQLIFDNVLPLR